MCSDVTTVEFAGTNAKNMESSIRLVVKTPNQRFKDIHIDCDLGWTVKKLKDYLASVHPTNPESVSQKLIYSGHLLKDEQQLKEVLSKDHDSHTVHIVCPNASEDGTKVKKPKTQPVVANTDCTDRTAVPNSDGLRQRNTANTNQYISSSNQWYGAGSPYNAYWQNYYTAMMQQYQQYQHPMSQMPNHTAAFAATQLYQWQQNVMAMYQQSHAGYPFGCAPGYQPPPVTPSSPAVHAEETGTVTDGPPPEVPIEQTQAEAGGIEQGQNNEQRNQNIPLNAGGAMFDDDDENGDERRDWLDWVHTFLRAAVMLSIMYFYSSTTRILMISLLGLLIYLYQTGWLTLRRAGDQAGNQELNQNGQARQQEDVIADRQNGEDNETENQDTGDNVDHQNSQQPQISPLRAQMNVLYTFVTSFFTSLLPQGAQ